MNNLEEFEIAYNKYTGRDTSAPVERLRHPVPGITYKYQYANDMLAFWNAARAGLIAQLEAVQKERDALREVHIGAGSNTRAAADIYFQLVEELEVPAGGSLVGVIENLKAELSAANEKLSKPVVLSLSTVMSRACAVRAIKSAGFTVEGE